jgi:hypothetical protein
MEIAGKRRRAVAQARAEQQAHDHAQPAFDLAALAAARAAGFSNVKEHHVLLDAERKL